MAMDGALHDAMVYLKQGQRYISEVMQQGDDPDRAHLCLMLALDELQRVDREQDRQEFLVKRKKDLIKRKTAQKVP